MTNLKKRNGFFSNMAVIETKHIKCKQTGIEWNFTGGINSKSLLRVFISHELPESHPSIIFFYLIIKTRITYVWSHL